MQAAPIIASPQALLSLCQDLAQETAFAFDTESNSLHAYHERVCLIQISTAQKDYLVDPLALPDLQPLAPLFADARIQKVLHAGDYDIACLKRDFGFSFSNLFDTMLAAQTLGESNLGLAALLESNFGIALEKKFQRANWGQRPLSAEMIAYAQNDSRYLLALRDKLTPQLKETGRWVTFLEDCAALAETPAASNGHNPQFWQVKGAQTLKPNQLGALQELQAMREALASKHDKPPFKILGDQALVDLAQNQPRYTQELELLPSLSPGLVRRYGKQILRTLDAWRSEPYALRLPRPVRMEEAHYNRRERLSDWRKVVGKAEGLPSNVVLPKNLLELISAEPLKTLAELEARMAASPSRFDRYGQEIFQLMTKETA